MSKIYICQNPCCLSNRYDDRIASFREIIQSGICPVCGGPLVVEESDNVQWYEEAFDSFPCVLAHEYKRLFDLYQQGKMYGALVQIKDVMEATIKFLALTAVAWGIKNVDQEQRVLGYETELVSKALSFGEWKFFLEKIKGFYNPKIRKVGFPICLYELIKDVPSWEGKNHLIQWRNENIGHGALGFEDDPKFRKNINDMINAITKFYKTHRVQFSQIQIQSDGQVLHGYKGARNLKELKGSCEITILGEEPFECSQFIIHDDHGIYFFDKLEELINSQLLSYPMGKFKMKPCEYITQLARQYRKNEIMESGTMSPYMSNIQSDFLSKLGCEGISVEPKYITRWLNSMVSKHKSGIFMLEMERGYGKSFYTEKLNSRFGSPWIIADDLDVRTYHLSRTQLGGISEFVDGISFEWNESYGKHSYVPIRLVADYSDKSNNVNNMIVFLKMCKERSMTPNYYSKQRIMLVLDGLDEISQRNEDIWSFIPHPDDLPEGIYILLTGRLIGRDKLPGNYVNKRNTIQLTEESFKVSAHLDNAHLDDNKEFLSDYLRSRRIELKGQKTEESLFIRAEYNVLNLSMWCDILNYNPDYINDSGEKETVVNLYLDMLERSYGENKTQEFRRLLLFLSEVAHYEPLSIEELSDLLYNGTLRFELLGMLSDLSPLLRINRAVRYQGGQFSDSNRFELIHEEYEKAILLRLRISGLNAEEELLEKLVDNICGEEPYAVKGAATILSHLSAIEEDLKIKIDWNPRKLQCVYNFIHAHILSDNSLLGWMRYRNSVGQIKRAWDFLNEDEKTETLGIIVNAIFEETSSNDDVNKYTFAEYQYRINEMKKMLDFSLLNEARINISYIVKLEILLAEYYGMIENNEEQYNYFTAAEKMGHLLRMTEREEVETCCILYSKLTSFFGGVLYQKARERKQDKTAKMYSQKAVEYIKKAIKARESVGQDDEIGDYSLYENYISLADLLDDLGNYEEAKKLYETYIPLIEGRLNSNNPKGIMTLWHAYYNYILTCKKHKTSYDIILQYIRKHELYKNNCVEALIVKLGIYEYIQHTITDLRLYINIYDDYKTDEIKNYIESRIEEIDARLANLPNAGGYLLLKIEFYYDAGMYICSISSHMDPVYYINKGIALLEEYIQYSNVTEYICSLIGRMYYRSVLFSYEHEGASTELIGERTKKALYWLKIAPITKETAEMITRLKDYDTLSTLF